VRGNWLRINLAVQRALEGVTLAELAVPFPPPRGREIPLRRAQIQGS
jgi:hypothetical protein